MDELKQFVLNKQLRSALASVGYRTSDVGEVGDNKIYTSDEIKDEFIESISSQDTFKPIQDHIIRLIDLDVIVPVHVKEGVMNKIVYFFFKDKRKFAQSSFCIAFFNTESNKIFVLVENVENIEYWKKEEVLSLILLHEFQHMTATYFPNSFMRLHAKSLIAYYKRFLKIYFKADVSDRDVYKLVNWIHFQTESRTGKTRMQDDLVQRYFSIMWNLLKPSYESTDQLKVDLYSFFRTMIIYLKNPSTYVQLVHQRDPACWKLFSALSESYKALNITQEVNSMCIQEVFAPGEVICMESEYNTQPRHFTLITQIKK